MKKRFQARSCFGVHDFSSFGFDHILGSAGPYVDDELGPSAKDIDVELIVFDEHSMANVSTIECELRHALDSLVNEHDKNPLQLSILPLLKWMGLKCTSVPWFVS